MKALIIHQDQITIYIYNKEFRDITLKRKRLIKQEKHKALLSNINIKKGLREWIGILCSWINKSPQIITNSVQSNQNSVRFED